jgi:outer membrane protein insertion porin family
MFFSCLVILAVAGVETPSLRGQAVSQTSQSTAGTSADQNGQGKNALPPANQIPNAAELPAYQLGTPLKTTRPPSVPAAGPAALAAWSGLQVSSIDFQGVVASQLQPLQAQLAQQPGQPLDPLKLRSSLRRLYATGLYSTIEVSGERSGDSVALIFQGQPELFIGLVSIDGVPSESFSSLLEGATNLSPGTPYSDARLNRGTTLLENVLKINGYYQGTVVAGHSLDPVNQQMDVNYIVTLGEQARVGSVTAKGTTVLTDKKFRKLSKLKPNTKVTRDTVSTAVDKLRSHYQAEQLLEAKVKLAQKDFVQPTNHMNYQFNVVQGHKVEVLFTGVKAGKGRIRNLIPVYEEGTVDEDLLNEGDRRVRDFYQRQGYFNVQVSHSSVVKDDKDTVITYDIQLGPVHDVEAVRLTGNHYFQTSLILPRLNVVAASFFDKHGLYSQALIASDVATIQAIYEGNGFSNVAVKPIVKTIDTDRKGNASKVVRIAVTYAITEGVQQRFGDYKLVGNVQVPNRVLIPLLNTDPGQPYSSSNLVGDRDAILSYYLSHGYDHAQVILSQVVDPRDKNLIDATQEITEGDPVHVNNVIISGLHYTRLKTVAPYIQVHPGDILNQSALVDTQRKLYDLTLFNNVNAAVQNPNGDQLRKNVLLQFTEAKRWDVTYGVGFQAQTGNPGSCNVETRLQENLNPYGFCGNSFGVSGLVSLNVSRINLRGSDNSVTLNLTYGSLEKIAVLTYTEPHPFGYRNLSFSLSGGYTNAQDVTTYAASRLEGTARLTQKFDKANTFIYQFAFRRIKVDPDTVQVAPDQIPLLSEPVKVGGPGVTWIRDTRRPSSLDASGGTYNTVQEFFSDSSFGSQANFNRIDGTNATYYPFGKTHRYVFARETRIAYERSFGNGSQELIPLPERIYAGGAQSHRGFAINSAGPRDSVTGYPVGGAAAFVNSFELRLPPPRLPYVGTSVSFVLFHDMGNAFVRGRDIWPSFLRLHQPDREDCKNLSLTYQEEPYPEPNSLGLTGHCSDNYFSHAIGVGARYGTPIGPIRLDLSYNLNPPIFPEIEGYDLSNSAAPAEVGQASHINFFFSIGQAF